jgi:hypothetical protein
MGVDLTLMPLLEKDYWVSHALIRLERRRALWPKIEALGARPVPEPLTCFQGVGPDGDPAYGEITQDPYGQPLTWLPAGELATLHDDETVQDNWLNQAAWAYLRQMPPDWPVVLYWH